MIDTTNVLSHERKANIMDSAKSYVGTIVAVVVLATLAIIVTILVVNANNAADQKARDKQNEHDKNVSFYYNQCTNGGTTGWQC